VTDRERVLWVMLIVALLAIGLTWWNVASAVEGCPAGTIQTPYGGPDETGYHWIYQPNEPAAYVYVLTSDGTRLGPFPFGQYGPYGDGQWYVCYVEDVTPFLYLANPVTTTTTMTPTTLATTTTTVPSPTTTKPRWVKHWGNRMVKAI